jgi:hypothetical protein
MVSSSMNSLDARSLTSAAANMGEQATAIAIGSVGFTDWSLGKSDAKLRDSTY